MCSRHKARRDYRLHQLSTVAAQHVQLLPPSASCSQAARCEAAPQRTIIHKTVNLVRPGQ